MSANLPSHLTLPLDQLLVTMERGSPRWVRCVSAGCGRLVLLPPELSFCDDCRSKWKRIGLEFP